jgi:hypothetical protein
LTPLCGDDEKQSTDREEHARDNLPGPRELEQRYLCSSEPDPGDQDE